MTTAYTSLLGLALPVTGELAGTWGDVVNNSITSLLDTAVAGTTTLSTDADVTLTTTTGASNQARQAILLCSGARTGIKNITAPGSSKSYIVINATTGGYAVVVRGAGPTTGVTVANGEKCVVAWNGSDFVKTGSSIADLSLVTNTLGVANGGTGSTSLTANNVLLGNGTSALQTVAPGTANNILYSNGTTWVAGPIPSTGAVTSFSAGTTGLTPNTTSTGNITLAGTLGVANGGTGQTTYTDGQLLIGNTAGNTLAKATLTPGTGISITNGAGSITITNTASGTPTLNVVTATTQTAVAGNHYVLTNVAATTVTLPASPTAGDVVWVTVGNGLTTNVVARNGNKIQSLSEDLTLNSAYAAVQMRYINSTIGWTFV